LNPSSPLDWRWRNRQLCCVLRWLQSWWSSPYTSLSVSTLFYYFLQLCPGANFLWECMWQISTIIIFWAKHLGLIIGILNLLWILLYVLHLPSLVFSHFLECSTSICPFGDANLLYNDMKYRGLTYNKHNQLLPS